MEISAVYLIGKAEIPIHYTIWALVEQALLTNLEFAWTGTFLMPKQKVFVVKVDQWQLLETGCQIATLLEAFQFCILWWRSVFLGFCTLWKTFLMKLMNYCYQMHSGLKVCIKNIFLFLFDHSSLCQKIFVVFWGNLRHQNFILTSMFGFKSPEVPFYGITSPYSYFEVIWFFFVNSARSKTWSRKTIS